MVIEFIVLGLSLILIASFSAAETSFVAADKVALIAGRGRGSTSKAAMFFLRNNELFFATVVVAANLFITIFSSLSESILHEQLHFSLVDVILFSTLVGFLAGELAPKSMAIDNSESSAKLLLPLVRIFCTAARPLVTMTAQLSSFIAEKFFGAPPHSAIFQRRDVYRFLSSTVSEGYLDKIESDIIRKFLTNANVPVRSIAVPRTQIIAVNVGTRIEKVRRICEKSGKSKVLVYDGSIDNIVGVVHAKELFRSATTVDELVSDVLFVPESLAAVDLLEEFRSEKLYAAVLIDEFGGTAGFVSSSDVIELFLGEVAVWSNEQQISPLGAKQYVVSGTAEVDQVESALRIKLPKGDYSTIAGMIISELGRIPAQGEKIYVRGFEFLVMKSDGRRVESLRLTLR